MKNQMDGGCGTRGRLSVVGVLLALGMLAGTAQAQVPATGGTITRYRENGTNFIAHIFTSDDTLTFTTGTNVEYLIVAGGGGGGGSYQGGGGGGGGFLTGITNVTAQAYTVTVGTGGNGYGQGSGLSKGGDSSLTNSSLAVIAYGGGTGGGEGYPGTSGGSGGGGAWGQAYGTGWSGPPIQGHNGGASAQMSGAGGGGAGDVGADAPSGTTGGDGGPGDTSTLRNGGTAVTYATGGDGSDGRTGDPGASKNANTGDGGNGGGGGSTAKGGNGGSGIVIVRYVDGGAFEANVTATDDTVRWPTNNTGTFTITRPADANTNYSMVVSYTMTGSATNGLHYSQELATNSAANYPTPSGQPLSGSVTFGVGVTSLVVNLAPLYEPQPPARSATMTLDADGSSPSATVNFQAWSVDAPNATATGGTVTNYFVGTTNYNVHIFTNSAVPDTLTVTKGGELEYLIVGGGGGGGGFWQGGGGGGGGFLTGTMTLPQGTYALSVGGGGAGHAGTTGNQAYSGTNSSLGGHVLVAYGGGYGGGQNAPTAGGNGGSGGGGSEGGLGGLGTTNPPPLQGYGGGNTGPNSSTGSGGGAGGPGTNGVNDTAVGGGPGRSSTFRDGVTAVTYAAGGHGSDRQITVVGVSGSANTGTGGGGSSKSSAATTDPGGNGGSGIVIVRYIVPAVTVTAPTNTQEFLVGSSIIATAAVYNASETSTVRFYTNTATGPSFGLAATDSAAPYTVDLGTGLAIDDYLIYATGSNAIDGVFFSATNAFSVKAPQLGVTVVEPGNGDGYVVGTPITATATVEYATGSISVEFFTNSVSAGTDIDGSPYTLALGTPPVGPHEIYAVVTANEGTATSATNDFTIYATAVLGGDLVRYHENGTNWIAHVFTNSAAAGTLNVIAATDVEYLIVAGGGGGGGAWQGGGGGAGGFLTGTTNLLMANYTVTVGAPGIGGYDDGNTLNGGDSSLTSPSLAVVAYGGGAGGGESYAGEDGGSGGGGAYANPGMGWAGPPTQGYDGGAGNQSGGGGGGAGGAGSNYVSSSVGGDGGPGRSSTMRNGVTAVTYATGGAGSNGRTAPSGPHRNPNTGDGGYGGGANSATGSGNNGGSGIVIVRHVDSQPFNPTVTATAATALWPSQTGAFTISRPVPLDAAMVVAYTMSGSAGNGVDYGRQATTNDVPKVPLSGYATMPTGAASVVVSLYPLNSLVSSPKVATMTLDDTVGSPATDDVNFPAWNVGSAVEASGGTVTNYDVGTTNYNAHIFTNTVGTTNIMLTSGGEVEYLIVGGGGGGGGYWQGGGGGGGGFITGTITLPAGTYAISVGDGGAGWDGSVVYNGGDSSLGGTALVAFGGGYGGGQAGGWHNGGNGGSGGGGAENGSGGTGTTSPQEGYDGGDGPGNYAGGGGGANDEGTIGSAATAPGGPGLSSTMRDGVTPVFYAAGGAGHQRTFEADGTSAAAETGNGGDGGGRNSTASLGGKGGSGIVIVRYVVVPPPAGTLFLLR